MIANRIILIIAIFISFYIQGLSQEKRFISFFATESGAVGHAFVSFVREDNNLRQTVVDGVWGLYPVSRADLAKNYFVGEVPGEIRDDFLTRPDVGLTVEVNQPEYENALQIKERWANSTYQLTERDCISFVIEIANSLSHKIHVPQRFRTDFPHTYINILKRLNDDTICSESQGIVNEYDREAENFHMYTHTETICDNSKDSCCTEELVFNVMRSKGKYTAPDGGDKPVVNCGPVRLPFFGPIITKLGSSPYSITNYTLPEHILHAGKVVRYIVKVGTKVNVHTVGIGINRNKIYALLNSNKFSVDFVWGGVNEGLRKAVKKEIDKKCGVKNSTLFLLDLSGSMRNNGNGTIPKIEQAKNASRTTLRAMRNNQLGISNEVAIYGFEGACRDDPTREIFGFDTDLVAAEKSIANLYTGGSTPLSQAIRAAECKLASHLQSNGQTKGKLILLSDGQGTCGEIRPNGIYHHAPLKKSQRTVFSDHCGNHHNQAVAVKYYTIGFDIKPGSPAERDLQYLSQLSGGKYLNVQNQAQLTRAFRKFNKVYRPKEYPALPAIPNQATSSFRGGVSEIKSEKFSKAIDTYEKFIKSYPDDCHGMYNMALAYEANDFYEEAIKYYQQYLVSCRNASDKNFVQNQIITLEKEFKDFVSFQQEVVRSDLEFLKIHFDRIQNGQSVALAKEFKGFLQEKGDYYKSLPRLIGKNSKFFAGLTEDIGNAFDRCSKMIRRDPKTWDRDAIPVISMTYLNLQELIAEM